MRVGEGLRSGRVAHLVLTRFSVKATPDSPPFATDWLEDRLRLLEAYCLPGLAGQTCSNFRWLLFCDESTDRDVVARLKRLAGAVPGAVVVLVGTRSPALPDILGDAAATADVVMTTRLDSDDGLALGFVERVQEYVVPFLDSDHDALLLNFQHGYKLAADGALYANYNPHSAFMTLCERVRDGHRPRSVQTENHGYLHLRYPLHQDASMVGWLQVVHGGNVSNKVHGTDVQVARELLDDGFAIRPEAAPEQTRVPAPQPDDVRERAVFRRRLEEALAPRGAPG